MNSVEGGVLGMSGFDEIVATTYTGKVHFCTMISNIALKYWFQDNFNFMLKAGSLD